jgi:hypothetical protein
MCGLAPGFAALRTNVSAQMKEGGRSGSGSATHARLRSGLVVLEIAVALMLLAAAGLLLRSFQKMSQANLGFEPDHVTTAAYLLPRKQYSTQAQIDTFNRDLLDRLRQLPETRAAGLASTIPMTGDENWAILAEGYVDPRGPDQRQLAAPFQVVGDYFRAMGIPLLRGRYFTDADDANGQLVAIVNHEFAEDYWPHQDPIGKRLRVGSSLKMPTLWMTVVGEVADAKLGPPDQGAGAVLPAGGSRGEGIWRAVPADRPGWQQRLHRGAVGAAAGPDGEHNARGGPGARPTTAAQPGADNG